MNMYFRKFGLTVVAITMTALPASMLASCNNAPKPAQAAAAASASSMPGQPVDLTYAAEKAIPCVVHIKNTQNSKVTTVDVQDPFGDFFDPFGWFGQRGEGNGTRKQKVQTPKQESTGSGVIISSDGYIVTNNHVVAGADELIVSLNDNTEYSAKVIGTDKNTDLALIKVSPKGKLDAIVIGNSDNLKVGEWVLAVGNPFNFNSSVTAGIVSAKARTLGQNGVESFIQTDAAINRGNSGGALVNTRGELVGINAMLYSNTGSYSGIGFAIPTSIMNKVVEDLKKYGTVQRALIGIQGTDVKNYIDSEKSKGNDIDLGTMTGIYVAKVVDDGAAQAAGITEGDVITSVDGKKITKFAELQEVLAEKRPGDKINITYLRKKHSHSTTLTLKNEQGNTKVVKNADLDVLGATFRPVTEQQKEQLNIGYGLEVLKVSSGKIREAGIQKGFIIQKANDNSIKSIEDLQNIVKEASTSKEPVLFIQGIYPSGKKAYFAVQLSD